MSADFCLHNYTLLPFHAAIGWNNIIQDYHNDIMPGQTVHLSFTGGGWSDFLVKLGGPADKFDHTKDWVGALEFGAAAGGAALTILTLGAGSGVAVAIEAGAGSMVAASAALEGASAAVTVMGLIGDVSGLIERPAVLTGLPRGRVFDVYLRGATVHGPLVPDPQDPSKQVVKVQSIDPAIIEWHDKLNGHKGTLGSGEKKAYQ